MRRTKGMWRLLVLVVLSVAASGCTLGSERASAPAERAAAEGPEPPPTTAPDGEAGWRLVAGRGPAGELDLAGREPTLVLRPRRISGFTGCNEFGARARVRGDRVRMRYPVTSTAIGCADRVAALEEGYFEALFDVERRRLVDGRLVLTGPATELVFEPLAPADTDGLAGRVWTLESYTVDGATRTVRERPATIELTADGLLEADTRCRDLAGRYRVQGHEIVLVRSRMSRRDHAGCPPDGVEQENAVVGALGDRFRVELDGDRLRIESRDGYALVLRAE